MQRLPIRVFLFAFSSALPALCEAAFFPDSAFSAKAAGTTGASFLKLPSGARAQALGTAMAAGADDSEAMFWNPAGLARLEAAGSSEFSFSFNSMLESAYAGTLAYAMPLRGGRGMLGASMIYFSQTPIDGFNTLGDKDSEFTPLDLSFGSFYAKKLGPVGLGAGLKVIHSSIGDASGTTFALDLGLQAQRVSDIGQGALDLGASIRNLGPAIKVGSTADPLPFKFQLGMHWHISPRLSALLDGHLPVDDDPYASLGVELGYPVSESLRAAFRAGYNVRNERGIDGLTGLSAGFGAQAGRFRVDYAWVPLGDLGSTHRISTGYLF